MLSLHGVLPAEAITISYDSPDTMMSVPPKALKERFFVRPCALHDVFEPWFYLLYAGACTLLSALTFFNSRALQLSWAEAARLSLDASAATRQVEPLWWSAPLDDTFIHFDFARSLAKLHPFEWVPGGGYSSGATSWLYPALLSFGILLGFQGQSLGVFADVLACTSVFVMLWATRSLFSGFLWASYLLPLFVLSSGVLDWSLWSGMELSLFFAIWAVFIFYYVEYRDSEQDSMRQHARWALAGLGLLLVTTRPESIICCIAVAAFAHVHDLRRNSARWSNFIFILLPASTMTATRALLNLSLTGSAADAGAIVKLLTLRPFLEPREVALRWLSNIGFQFSRITIYHTSDSLAWCWQLWLLVGLAVLARQSRTLVSLLLVQALGWLLLVAQNEYVRYQNDRYTMPVVLWLLIAITVGLGSTLETARRALLKREWNFELSKAAIGALVACSFLAHQLPRLRQQRWHFGRACRNIAEQQARVGQLFRAGAFGRTERILVGDAGAIPYFSGLGAVDAIGLGGTDRLPFAQAVNLGVGATIELIERLAPDRRPDRFALYPSWWELLPVWFGRPMGSVPINGNVICGGTNKVVYEATWRGLERISRPLTLALGHRIVDELDFADLVSESAHDYQITSKHSGFVVMKLLPHPQFPERDIFDAGRLVFAGAKARFVLRGLRQSRPATLVFRAAPNYRMGLRVFADGYDAGRIVFQGGTGWQEASLPLETRKLRTTTRIELIADTAEHILYHLWVTAPEHDLD